MDSKDQQQKDEGGKAFGIMPIAQDNSNKAIDVLKAAPGPVQVQNLENFPTVEGTKEEREARKKELNK
ncbi:hypothetical protein ESCO_003249 [Escovopsis weberi]|uniref:Uncharacterized protein n=1 Tax=Escovopsis weberi TaxID=150374 RepID=A0A0M9VSF9_ESCWE|nr:hypothetical protein ESCO_003249 [Escovopsis weberi]